MELKSIIELFNRINISDLPGINAQLKMAPEFRDEELIKISPNSETKTSAILIPLFEKKGKAFTIMTKRSMSLSHHPGQISFPGGSKDKSDLNLQQTALRETEEELGISFNNIEIIGELSSLFIPPSNFMVYPYIGVIKDKFDVIINPEEVEKVFEIPIELFLNENKIETFEFRSSEGKVRKSPCYYWDNDFIWGASAMIIGELIEILKK